MKHIFIINPAAGNKQEIASLENNIRTACTNKQVDYTIYKTKGKGDATSYVASLAESKEKMRIYAVGGDGTLNEVISGAPLAPHISYGLIPHGTGNDFHRNFTNGDYFFDIERQIEGETHRIDVFRCNDTYGINMVNIGFDCEVVRETGRLQAKHKIPKKMAYIAGLVRVFFRKIGTNFKLTLENGESFDYDLTLGLIANGCFCGGGFKSAPIASLSDGLLDVCIIKKVSHFRFLTAVSAYQKGEHLNPKHHYDFIDYRQTPSVTIEFSSPHRYCIDGQISSTQRLTIEVCHQALNFVFPSGTSTINEKIGNEGVASLCQKQSKQASTFGVRSS